MASGEYFLLCCDCILAFVDIILLIGLICIYLSDKLHTQRAIHRVEVEHRVYRLMADDLMRSVKIIARAQGSYDHKGQEGGEEVAPNTGGVNLERGSRSTSVMSGVENSDGAGRGNDDQPGGEAAKVKAEGTHEDAARVNLDGIVKVNVDKGREEAAEVNVERVDEDTVKVNIEEISTFENGQCPTVSKFMG